MIPKFGIENAGAITNLRLTVRSGKEYWFLLRSDVHYDATSCNRDLEKKHLEKAKERGAIIFDGGDLFDAMQGRFDPRRSMDDLRPEYQRDDYYDFVVKDVGEHLEPYAKNFAIFCRGNHERSVRKHSGTDLTDRLAFFLNALHGSQAVPGGFGGWIRILFSRNNKTQLGSIKIKYFHGAGGDAPVTKGVIQTNRQAVYLPDANIVWNGHNHNEYILALTRERLGHKNNHYFDLQWHVRTPGYKQEYGDGSVGWAVETGKSPKPIGAAWLKIQVHRNDIRFKLEADIEGPEIVSGLNTVGPEREPYPEDSEYP